MSGLMSARGTANLLTRATAIAATLFFVSSLLLSILVTNSGDRGSIVDNMAGVRLNGALDISTPIAVIVCLGIVVAGLLLGAQRLQRMEID